MPFRTSRCLLILLLLVTLSGPGYSTDATDIPMPRKIENKVEHALIGFVAWMRALWYGEPVQVVVGTDLGDKSTRK